MIDSKSLKHHQDPKKKSTDKKDETPIISTLQKKSKQIKKPKMPPIVHYQTHLMAKQFMTYCGRRNISTSVKTTFLKSEVTCYHCLKYLNMI